MAPITLLGRLVKIESDSDITRIQNFILDQLGDVELDSTGCIVARKEGDGLGPTLPLNTHMDVVSRISSLIGMATVSEDVAQPTRKGVSQPDSCRSISLDTIESEHSLGIAMGE